MSRSHYITKEPKREHLNFAERKLIQRHLRQGANKAEIARLLQRDKSTVKREIRRGSVIQRRPVKYISKNPKAPAYIETLVYFADVGQRVYEENRQNCGAKNKVITCKDFVKYVEEQILGPEKRSPDSVIGHAIANNKFPGQEFSTKTFYNWIDDGLVKVKNIDLLLKVQRKPKSPRRERKKKLGKSIEERPPEVQAREEFGHWEGDGITGKGGKGQIITLVERKIGLGLMFNARSREQEKMVEIIDGLQAQFSKHFGEIFKTITLDNGSEFSDSAGMEREGRTSVFYAHPYSSFERGTNENWNGIVRRFIPKGKSFDDLTDDDLQRINHYINTMPRKRFGYKTPLDLWKAQIDKIISA
ncbi:MAG: IS30 family transposase [Clostridiales bacterium]|nr:IS30 family transposase [Clostridiales bacterium]